MNRTVCDRGIGAQSVQYETGRDEKYGVVVMMVTFRTRCTAKDTKNCSI